MVKRLLLFLSALFVFVNVVYSALSTTSYSVDVVGTGYPNQTAQITIRYTYSGRNYNCIPLISPCGRALFFRVFIYDSAGREVMRFRTGRSECRVDLSLRDCDISYAFDGSVISGSVTNTVNLSAGNYTVKVEFAVDMSYGSDTLVATRTATLSVPLVTQVTQPQVVQNVTQVTTDTRVDIGLRDSVRISPSTIYVGDRVNILIPIYLVVFSGTEYGPFLEIYIRDSAGRQVAYYRAGEQGVTNNPSVNYYFNYQPLNVRRTYDINITFSPTTRDRYDIYIKPRYSVRFSTDRDLGPERLIYSFVVQDRPVEQVTQQVSLDPQVVVEIGRVNMTGEAYVGQQLTFRVPVTINVLYGTEYGPFIEFYIRDVSGNTLAYYRAGEQGVTNNPSTNYYFSYQPLNTRRTYTISFVYIPTREGTFFIYAKPRYSVRYASDRDLGPERLIHSFIVQRKVDETGICTDVPPISYTAWMVNNTIITSAIVGTRVEAVASFVNPKQCKYVGEVTIEIKRHVPFAPDQVILTRTIPIEIESGKEFRVNVSVTFPQAGRYHFDIYYKSLNVSYKYTSKDVGRIYGTPGTDFAGPSLEVSEQKTTEAAISVVEYYFEQAGIKTMKLVENIEARGCLVLTSTEPIYANLRLEIYGYNVLGLETSATLFGNLKAYKEERAQLIPGSNYTICANFVPVQSSRLHPEIFYMVLKVDGNVFGRYPPDRKGAEIIQEQEYKKTNIVLTDAGWYDSIGNLITKGTWTSGKFYIKAKFVNRGNIPASGIVGRIVVKSPGALFGIFKTEIHECTEILNINAGETKEMVCEVELADGKYFFEVYLDKDKIHTSPTITIGILPHITDFINKIIAVVGIGGIILIVLFIFFGPYILYGISLMGTAIRNIIELFKKK